MVNTPVTCGEYTFTLKFSQGPTENIYAMNLRLKQKDTKENHLIKFRFGIGKDLPTNSKTHETDKPHFEISLYKREKSSFSADVYFTFDTIDEEEIMKYMKGTVVLIKDILEYFISQYGIEATLLEQLIYADVVTQELEEFKAAVLDALVRCYHNHELIVRTAQKVHIIKTEHTFEKYLNKKDLKPMYTLLKERL